MSRVPDPIQQLIKDHLNAEIKSFAFSAGGCINETGKLTTSAGDFFLKWNAVKNYPGMFEAEAKGLTLLRKSTVIHVPEIVFVSETDSWQFIVMEFAEGKSRSQHFWKDFGRQLALLHQNSTETFGLDHDNYIGSLRQYNNQSDNWIEFFIEQRLAIQIKLAVDSKKVSKAIGLQFEDLYNKLHELLPYEKPALLHGDLWSGNLITDLAGNPCLIDPAVYYGNREAELAFTRLFGGFPKEFYQNYNDTFPMQYGYSDRIDIYNLYPLMVHVNLFAGGYLSQVVSILRHFV